MPVKNRKAQFKTKHKKDFNWKTKRKNPFHIEAEPSVVKQRTLIVMLVGSLIATSWILLYHSFFRITDITIEGLVRIDEQAFTEGVRSTMYGNKSIFIPRDNYFFLNTEEMEAILRDRFVLEDISIIQSFPNMIDVVVQEKISTIIYDNGETYSYMGIDGKVVEEIRKVGEDEWFERYDTSTSTLEDGTVTTTRTLIARWHTPPHTKVRIEMGEYPIVYDMKPEEGEYQYTYEQIETMLTVQDILTEQFSLDTTYIVTEDDRSALFVTKQGTQVRVDLSTDPETYVQMLNEISYNIDLSHKREIDLRFGERVYVR